MSFAGHPLWWLLLAAALAWYATVTVVVAFLGAREVRAIFASARADDAPPRPPAPEPVPRDLEDPLR